MVYCLGVVVAGFVHKMSLHYGQPHEWMDGWNVVHSITSSGLACKVWMWLIFIEQTGNQFFLIGLLQARNYYSPTGLFIYLFIGWIFILWQQILLEKIGIKKTVNLIFFWGCKHCKTFKTFKKNYKKKKKKEKKPWVQYCAININA